MKLIKHFFKWHKINYKKMGYGDDLELKFFDGDDVYSDEEFQAFFDLDVIPPEAIEKLNKFVNFVIGDPNQ